MLHIIYFQAEKDNPIQSNDCIFHLDFEKPFEMIHFTVINIRKSVEYSSMTFLGKYIEHWKV